MSTPTRLQHSSRAIAHPFSAKAWRDSFAVGNADAIYIPAIKVGIAATLVLVIGGLTGQYQLAGIAALGALTSAFGRYQPYRRLGRQLAVVFLAMVTAATTGAVLGAIAAPLWIQILTLSIIGGLAAMVFSALRILGPGPVILVFAASAGLGYAHSAAQIPLVMVAVVIGAGIGWTTAMSPAIFNPLGPARLATARALATFETGADAQKQQAAVAAAREVIRASTPLFGHHEARRRNVALAFRAAQLHQILDNAESGHGGGQHESTLRSIAKHPTIVPGESAHDRSRPSDKHQLFPGALGHFLHRNAAHQGLRIAIASAGAGFLASALGLAHPLWASMGAVAVLQGINYHVTVQRGIQRLLGNVVGALIAAFILSLQWGFWPSVAVVIVCQFAAELAVLKNYAWTTIAVTPMALIMTGLGTHLSPAAAVSRVEDTLVGVVLGIAVAAVSISRSDTHHLPR